MKPYVCLALGLSMFALAACDHAHYEPRLSRVSIDGYAKTKKSDKKLEKSKTDLPGIDDAQAKEDGKAAYKDQCDNTILQAPTADEKTIEMKDLTASLDLQKVTFFSNDQTTNSQIEGVWSLEGGQASVLCHNTVSSDSVNTSFISGVSIPYHIEKNGKVTMAALALQAKGGAVAAQFSRADAKSPAVKTDVLKNGFFTGKKNQSVLPSSASFVSRPDGSIVWRFHFSAKNVDRDVVDYNVEAVYGSIQTADIVNPTTTAQSNSEASK